MRHLMAPAMDAVLGRMVNGDVQRFDN